jgi:hypothetical protein
MPIGNASGYGPQDYGGAPTPFEAMQSQAAQASSAQLLQWAMMTDPRVQAASRIGAQVFTGRDWQDKDVQQHHGQSAKEFLNSEAGRAMQMGIATAAGQGLMGGGSIAQFAFGAQQMAGNSGFQLKASDGLGPFYGQGFLTDMTSKTLMNEVRSQFMNPVTGLPSRPGAMNYSDMGESMYEFGRRGMFAGSPVAELERLAKDQVADRAKQYRSEGNTEAAAALQHMSKADLAAGGDGGAFETKFNRSALDKINRTFKETGELLSEFRDVFGPNMGVGKMMEEAEKLTGMSYGQSGTPQQAKTKLTSLKLMAQTTGESIQNVLARDQNLMAASAQQMSQMYGGRPEDYVSMAAVQTPLMWQQTQAASEAQKNAMREARETRGSGFIRSFSDNEIDALNIRGANTILGEEQGAVEASFIAEKFLDPTDPRAAAIRKNVQALGREGNESKRQTIRADISRSVRDAGFQEGQILASYGGDIGEMTSQMSVEGRRRLAEMASNQDRARSAENDIRRIGTQFNFDTRYGMGESQMSDISSVFAALGKTGLGEVGGLMRGGDKDKLSDYLSKNSSYFEKGTDTKALAERMMGVNAEGFGRFNNMVINDRMLANSASRRDIEQNEDRQTARYFQNNSLGGGRFNAGSFAQNVMSGMLGHTQIDDASVIQYMQNTSGMPAGALQTLQLNKAGTGFDLTDDQLKNLDRATKGGLFSSFNVGNDAAGLNELREKFSGQRGATEMRNWLAGNNVHSAVGPNGSLTVADSGAFAAAEGSAQDIANTRTNLILSGLDSDQVDKEMGRVAKLDQKKLGGALSDLRKQYTGDFTKDEKLMDHIMSGAANDRLGVLDSLKQRLQDDPSGATHKYIQEHMNELQKKRDKGDKKAGEQLDTYRTAMAMAGGGQGGNNYLGILELQSNNKAFMKLFQKS